MAAETAGMTADHSESHESSWHLDRHSIYEKAALDAATAVPSGSYVQKEFPVERADSLLDSQSEQSAVIPAVSAAICVSLFSLVCRRSVVPSFRLPVASHFFAGAAPGFEKSTCGGPCCASFVGLKYFLGCAPVTFAVMTYGNCRMNALYLLTDWL